MQSHSTDATTMVPCCQIYNKRLQQCSSTHGGNVPRQTRNFLINHLLALKMVGASEEILARFTGVMNKLFLYPCREGHRVVAALTSHDLKTVTGRNVALTE